MAIRFQINATLGTATAPNSLILYPPTIKIQSLLFYLGSDRIANSFAKLKEHRPVDEHEVLALEKYISGSNTISSSWGIEFDKNKGSRRLAILPSGFHHGAMTFADDGHKKTPRESLEA
ncbi:MAG: hypothetical protein P8L78_15440 [Mariniblastus sp.]|nr:hypothetical protein [Mariniblastus sp.]